jgi:hypothetical protein
MTIASEINRKWQSVSDAVRGIASIGGAGKSSDSATAGTALGECQTVGLDRASLRSKLIIGGWVEGNGHCHGLPVELIVGYFQGDRFVYAGRCGIDPIDAQLMKLIRMLGPERSTSPFEDDPGMPGIHFVHPRLEFEVSAQDIGV